MRSILRKIKVLLCWITGKGPWLVVGHWHDDEGKLRKFVTWTPTSSSGLFDSLDEANEYCAHRNFEAGTDPLAAAYYVYHRDEFYKENN